MDNLDRATTIRRTVNNKAHELLKNCKEPEEIYDGYYDDHFIEEHWEIDLQDLIYEAGIALDKVLDFEEGDKTDQQIKTHCTLFLDSQEYEDMKDEIRRDFYQQQRDRKDWNETKRGLMRA